jgi:hypothetical protein
LAVHGGGTGIHSRQQLKTRRIARAVPGPGHHDFACFQGLAERLKRGPGKLRELIEEQHATVG